MAALTLGSALLKGTVAAPPSKSMAHRGLILSMLSGGSAEPMEESKDIAATRQCMEVLLTGQKDFYCNESGSTLRFMVPLAMALNGGGVFHRKGRLAARPIETYETLFPQASFSKDEPLVVSGKLEAGSYTLSGNISSQFITGLLLALPLVKGNSEIHVLPPFESMAYVDLTLDAMAAFGIIVSRPTPEDFYIRGEQSYQPCHYLVEGDYSQAAVFLCAKALGHPIEVTGLNPLSRQGDRAILDIIQNKPNVIDASQCPDIIPMAALYLCLQDGAFSIENGARLRLKECDRLAATVTLLSALGASIQLEGDTMKIQGVPSLKGGITVDCCNDHRMAMMLSIAGLHCDKPITLNGVDCVSKSWPTYFDTYFRLGGKQL